MLGVDRRTRASTAADELLREYGERSSASATRSRHTRVGVFFGEPAGERVDDPYFGGDGPDRTGCMRCGACMVGCRYGAKNTLVKNYLWFAEQLGAKVIAERQVTDIRPLGAADGSHGYAVDDLAPGRLAAPPATHASPPAAS